MRASICGAEFVMCDAYIDQKRYIGSDFVGYKCGSVFIACVVDGRTLCASCSKILAETPERVSFAEKLVSGARDGIPWKRDPDFPCALFYPGEPEAGAECQGDGHHLCKECTRYAGEEDDS